MACTRRSRAASASWVGHGRRAASRRNGRRFRVWKWRHLGLPPDDPVSAGSDMSRLRTTGLLRSTSSRATASAIRNRCPRRPQRLEAETVPGERSTFRPNRVPASRSASGMSRLQYNAAGSSPESQCSARGPVALSTWAL
jgi:hypothetical protein